jgi:hypothetical protein
MTLSATLFDKLKWSLPWLVRYPGWRLGELLRRATAGGGVPHLIIMVANHYEPSYAGSFQFLPLAEQQKRVQDWRQQARAIGRAICDHEGTPFRHTYFYPGEQYDRGILDMLAELQAEGLGEVEIHLHHGMEEPDTAENTRRSLAEFRDLLAEEHGCLARHPAWPTPMYAFVHGSFALANSEDGLWCGVDEELQILAETGCYADFTLPAVPYRAQVPKFNAIYTCGKPLHERLPHASGPALRIGSQVQMPVIVNGPLVFNWRRRIKGLPVPRVDDGVLGANYPLDITRVRRWRGAHMCVQGRPEWVFIKLFCHGFFAQDTPYVIGEPLSRALGELLDHADRTGEFKIHFATTREAFNMILAAVDGQAGNPGAFRDYRLQQIMKMKAAPEVKLGRVAGR